MLFMQVIVNMVRTFSLILVQYIHFFFPVVLAVELRELDENSQFMYWIWIWFGLALMLT